MFLTDVPLQVHLFERYLKQHADELGIYDTRQRRDGWIVWRFEEKD